MKRFILILISFSFLALSSLAQGLNRLGQRDYLRDLWLSRLNDQLEQNLLAPEDLPSALESLEQLLEQSIDINSITASELRKIPILSDYQIYQFVHYRSQNPEKILALEDLKSIPSWDERTLRCLLPLFHLTDEPVWGFQKFYQLSTMYGRRRRQKSEEDYLGAMDYFAMSLRLKLKNMGYFYFSGEKDYGEPWRYEKHKGLDSYHVSGDLNLGIRPLWGAVQRIVLGSFRTSFGEGLCIRQGFRQFKMSTKNTYSNSFSPVRTTTEQNILKGIAVEGESMGIKSRAFVAYQDLDGKITNKIITRLGDSGLHRSKEELMMKDKVSMMSYGFQIAKQFKDLDLSLHALYYHFEKDYRLARAVGASRIEALQNLPNYLNVGLSYCYRSPQGYVVSSGELARGRAGKFAYVSSNNFHLPHTGDLALRLRYINPSYWSYYAQSYTHFARPNNEKGLMLAFSSSELIPKTSLSAYYDIYRRIRRFEGLKNGGQSFVLSLSHDLSRWFELKESIGMTEDDLLNKRWTARMKAKLFINSFSDIEASLSTAYTSQAFSQLYALKYHVRLNSGLKLDSSILWHDVPSWAGRLYYHEAQLQDEYQSLFLYRKGFRLGLRVKYQPRNSSFSYGFRFAYHKYQEEFGTKLEGIFRLSYVL